jgi:hypothetical protein
MTITLQDFIAYKDNTFCSGNSPLGGFKSAPVIRLRRFILPTGFLHLKLAHVFILLVYK